MRVEAEDSTDETLGTFLDIDLEGPGIHQREAPCLALGLGGGRADEGQEGIMKMGGEPSSATKTIRLSVG